MITDATGQVLERQSFDAFGSRRIATTWRDPVAALTSMFSTRGFTGHEQLDAVGLIHMNGRVYDPQLGRFLSADPMVQHPAGAQGLNRYSYTDNNPLSRVDPSGYGWLSKAWKKVKKVFKNPVVRAVVAIAASVVTFGYAGLLTSSPFWGAAAGGFVGGTIVTGTLKGGVIGAFTAGAFYGVGSWAGAWHWSAKTLAHGVVGGTSSAASGGRFKEGFMSAGFTQFASPTLGRVSGDAVGRTVAAAVVGGTAAELGGGKFANGAKTFGFLRLFGEAADYYEYSVGRTANPMPGENRPGQTTYEFDRNGRQYSDSWDINVVGNNDLTSFCRQGSVCSKALNVVLIANATAGLHDYWFNAGVIKDFNFVTNYGTIPAAGVVSTGAVLGSLTQGWDRNPTLMFYLTMPRD